MKVFVLSSYSQNSVAAEIVWVKLVWFIVLFSGEKHKSVKMVRKKYFEMFFCKTVQNFIFIKDHKQTLLFAVIISPFHTSWKYKLGMHLLS